MKRAIQFAIVTVIFAIPSLAITQSNNSCKLKDQIISDYKNFYSLDNLWKLALGTAYAGFYANTSFDQEIQDFYQDYVKVSTTDDISKIVKPFGDGRITVPIYLTTVLVGELTKDTKVGSTIGGWGKRCSRTLLVGAPLVLTFQVVTGASRPAENNGSHWHPFKDNNGVSGHSFMGAVPFLTAAKMTDQRFLKYSLFVGSTLTGLSRINDNQHYFSQAFLGWWIAFLTANSVDMNKAVFVPSAEKIGVLICF